MHDIVVIRWNIIVSRAQKNKQKQLFHKVLLFFDAYAESKLRAKKMQIWDKH